MVDLGRIGIALDDHNTDRKEHVSRTKPSAMLDEEIRNSRRTAVWRNDVIFCLAGSGHLAVSPDTIKKAYLT